MENVPMGILLQPSRDVANFADSINRFANTVMTLDGQERQREATAMRLAHVSEYGLKLTDAADGIFTGAQEASAPDMPTFQQMLSDTFQSSYDRLQKATADDPILRTALSREHNKIQLHYGMKFRDLDRTKKAQFAITQVFDSFLADGKKYMEAATPDDEAFYVNRIADTINRAEISQASTPEKIYEYRATLEGLTNKKTITNIESAINGAETMLPEQRTQFIKDLVDPTKFTSLSVEERRVLWNKAATVFKEVNKEQAVAAAYEGLYKAAGGDFAKMGEYLNDPTNRKELGLSMEQTDYLRGYISRAETDKKQQQTAIYDKTAKEMFLNLNSLTPKKINDAVRNGQLDYKTAESFKTHLKQVGEGKTDPATYDRFLQDIYSETKTPEEIRAEIYRTGGLSRADKEKLLTKTESKIEKMDAKNLTRAMAYLKETVMPSQTMIKAAKPDEALNYLKATEAMEAAVVDARKAGKPLNSKQVIEKAQEISQAFKMSTREQMEAARKRMQEDAKKMKPALTAPQPESELRRDYQVGGKPKLLKFNPITGKLE